MKTILCALSVLILFSCKKEDTTTDKENPPPVTGGTSTTNESQLLSLVNNVRKAGCTCGSTAMPAVPEISWNDLLEKAAVDHSIDMNKNNYFSHTGQNGSDSGKRITAAGYTWKAYGENIAKGYTSEAAVMDG